MLKTKKSQGLSITTIIVVAIGLIVLVVLVAVFTGRVGDFGGDVDTSRSCQSSCSALGGTGDDQLSTECTTEQDEKFIPGSFNGITEGCCCTGVGYGGDGETGLETCDDACTGQGYASGSWVSPSDDCADGGDTSIGTGFDADPGGDATCCCTSS